MQAPRDGRTIWSRAWLAMLLAGVVIIPRSALIVHAHSETMDEEYHLTRGVRFWSKSLGGRIGLNDPPLGEGIIALPLLAAGSELEQNVLYGQANSPDMLRLLVAIWKSLLFLPLVGLAFVWMRELYGLASAWLAAGLLTLEPNFAAHIPLATVDVPAVEAILIACFLAWRYLQRPSVWRAVGVAGATAAAMLIKHTAIILPIVIAGYAALSWRGRLVRARRRSRSEERLGQDTQATYALSPRGGWKLAGDAGLALIVGLVSLWAFTLFDVSRPFVPRAFAAQHPALAETLARPLPAGVYLKSLAGGMTHAAVGHPAYLLGERRTTGWWYYFPVVATYKVPIVIGLLGLISLASFWAVRARWGELSLLLPLLAWLIFVMCSRINIGFRHVLPAYVFALLLVTRFLAAPGRGWRIVAAVAMTLLAIESLIHHPNYLSYINFPRHKPHLAINDSNIDWGQSLKQIRRWLEENPQAKPVYLRYFGRPNSSNVRHYLGDRIEILNLDHRPPVTGILIISPYWEAGVGDAADRYRLLRPATPTAIIGNSMMVYDLDRVKGWKAAHRRIR